MAKKIVFICGYKRSGKTTAARYLEKAYGASVYSFADSHIETALQEVRGSTGFSIDTQEKLELVTDNPFYMLTNSGPLLFAACVTLFTIVSICHNEGCLFEFRGLILLLAWLVVVPCYALVMRQQFLNGYSRMLVSTYERLPKDLSHASSLRTEIKVDPNDINVIQDCCSADELSAFCQHEDNNTELILLVIERIGTSRVGSFTSNSYRQIIAYAQEHGIKIVKIHNPKGRPAALGEQLDKLFKTG